MEKTLQKGYITKKKSRSNGLIEEARAPVVVV
jgi:hypothetical protein